jgi:hypothetical protein
MVRIFRDYSISRSRKGERLKEGKGYLLLVRLLFFFNYVPDPLIIILGACSHDPSKLIKSFLKSSIEFIE